MIDGLCSMSCAEVSRTALPVFTSRTLSIASQKGRPGTAVTSISALSKPVLRSTTASAEIAGPTHHSSGISRVTVVCSGDVAAGRVKQSPGTHPLVPSSASQQYQNSVASTTGPAQGSTRMRP
eukprot:CAMPEP_0170147824 /NCGR_PEP_ID=MMETSP0033_2-20121228/35966_1 /TAXON_ID=195969 /ORGANISM="Dolichomastix tenuilepis, Strain CCMP3274" /LENGTH=122 /DNA_ID=CAMNT_0010384673 /DNA_START=318 /DNA_END=686 /DNA_ORIENTATION=-